MVAIPSGNPEQECNAQCLVRKRHRRALHARRIGVEQILGPIDRALGDEPARRRAEEYGASVRAHDGPANAARGPGVSNC